LELLKKGKRPTRGGEYSRERGVRKVARHLGGTKIADLHEPRKFPEEKSGRIKEIAGIQQTRERRPRTDQWDRYRLDNKESREDGWDGG